MAFTQTAILSVYLCVQIAALPQERLLSWQGWKLKGSPARPLTREGQQPMWTWQNLATAGTGLADLQMALLVGSTPTRRRQSPCIFSIPLGLQTWCWYLFQGVAWVLLRIKCLSVAGSWGYRFILFSLFILHLSLE